jgi:hypothetical protein
MEKEDYTEPYIESDFEAQFAEEFIGLDGLGEFPEWQHPDYGDTREIAEPAA